MSGEESRFTSDRRVPSKSSWKDGNDWVAGTAENVDVVEEGLIGRTPPQVSEFLDGAVHQWRLDEGSQSTVSDSIGSATGTSDDPAWVSSGDYVGGYGFDFVGSNPITVDSNMVDVGDVGTLFLTAKPRDGGSQQFIFDHGDWEQKNRLRIQIESDGTWGYSLAGDGGVSTGIPVSLNTLARATLRWDSGSYWYFLNGSQVDSGSYSGTLSSTTSKGRWSFGASSYDGIADNYILCGSAVPDSQIADDYNQQPWA